tara:strand:- start:263 stop:910 length:648 start_codon:yes stop_codon:yes gene_type:complete
MSNTKKVIAVNVEKVTTALDKYFGAVDAENKAVDIKAETVQAFNKAVGFDWFNATLSALKPVSPNLYKAFRENVLARYLNTNVGIDSVKMGKIEYNFTVEDILEKDAKELKELYPNAELYAYLNDNKTGLRRRANKFINHAFTDLAKLAKPDTEKEEKEDKEDKTRNELTIEVLNKEIGKYRNACTGSNPTMSENDAMVAISSLETTISVISKLN